MTTDTKQVLGNSVTRTKTYKHSGDTSGAQQKAMVLREIARTGLQEKLVNEIGPSPHAYFIRKQIMRILRQRPIFPGEALQSMRNTAKPANEWTQRCRRM